MCFRNSFFPACARSSLLLEAGCAVLVAAWLCGDTVALDLGGSGGGFWIPSVHEEDEAVEDEHEEEEDLHALEQMMEFVVAGGWWAAEADGGNWNLMLNSARPIGAVDALVVVAGGGGPVADGEGGCRRFFVARAGYQASEPSKFSCIGCW